MSSTLKSLRALADPTRLRIVALLERDELSVNELQEITRLQWEGERMLESGPEFRHN